MNGFTKILFSLIFLASMFFGENKFICANEIDSNVVEKIKELSKTLESFKSYRYKLTNITFKKNKALTNTMLYNYRKPDNIRIEWLAPKSRRGQLAVYSNKVMKVAPSWLPFVVEVDPDSALGMADGNYPIYRSSVGALLIQTISDFPRLKSAKVIEEKHDYIIYQLVNDTNTAKIKVNKRKNIALSIEQFDLKGNLVDSGTFDDFEYNIDFDKDFFSL